LFVIEFYIGFFATDTRGCFFDGRKDRTLVASNGKTPIRVEEHISVVGQPGNNYIDHLTPRSGKAEDIASSLLALDCFADLIVVGCDGTATNTGCSGGVIRHLEIELGKPLQWMVCLLHANELPLRHLLEFLDGATTGPSQRQGPISKGMEDCTQLPVIDFQPVPFSCSALDDIDSELSSDQRYLHRIANAVSDGHVTEDLASASPGKVCHARWLTTANRILRLYVSTSVGSPIYMKLKTAVLFIVAVYAPVFFSVKKNSTCQDGAKNFFLLLKLSRSMSADVKAIIDPVIQRNAYWAHPENILLGMLADHRPYVRSLAIRRILKARDNHIPQRQFRVPKLKFSAESYEDMIFWSNQNLTEPPLTKCLTTATLKAHLTDNDGLTPPLTFPKFPCHTQSVERCVKLVTEVSLRTCGHLRRHGLIKNTLLGRENMPRFESAKDFKTL
jgi:hypothetical protein